MATNITVAANITVAPEVVMPEECGGDVASATSEGIDLHTFNNMIRRSEAQERQKRGGTKRLDALDSLSHARKTIINIRRDEALVPWPATVGASLKGVQAGPMVVTRLIDQGLAKEIEDEVEQLMGRVMSETHGILSHATATDDQGRDAMDRALLLGDFPSEQRPVAVAVTRQRLQSGKLQACHDPTSTSAVAPRQTLRQASSSSLASPQGAGHNQPQASATPPGQEINLQYDDPILSMVAAMVPDAGDTSSTLSDDEGDEVDRQPSYSLTTPGTGGGGSFSWRTSSTGGAPGLARTSLGGTSITRSRPSLTPLTIPGAASGPGSGTQLSRASSPQVVLAPLVSPSPPAHLAPVLGTSAPCSPRASLSGARSSARPAAPLRSRLTNTNTLERSSRSGAASAASGPASRASSTGRGLNKGSQIDAAFQMVMAAVDRIRATEDGEQGFGSPPGISSSPAASSKASPQPAQSAANSLSTAFAGRSVFASPVQQPAPVLVPSPGAKRKLLPSTSTSFGGSAGGDDPPLPSRMSFPGHPAVTLASSPKYSERSSSNGRTGMLPQGKAPCLSPLSALPSLPSAARSTAEEATPIGALPLSELLSRISIREKSKQRPA